MSATGIYWVKHNIYVLFLCESSSQLSESKGLNINCEDHHGNTALHLAAMRDHCAVAVILLQHGINTQHKNIAGKKKISFVFLIC